MVKDSRVLITVLLLTLFFVNIDILCMYVNVSSGYTYIIGVMAGIIGMISSALFIGD